MRFRTYAGASRGINDVMGAFASRGGNAYGDQMRDLAYVDSARASAAQADSETGLNNQKFAARESLPGVLQGIPMPPGMTPNVLASLYAGSENPNLRDVTQGFGDLQTAEAQRRALEAAQRGDVNSLNMNSAAGKPGTLYAPNEMSDAGVINTATGAHAWSPGHGALVGQRNAAAGASAASARASDAHARLYDVQAGMERYLPVAPGYTVFEQNPNAGQPAPAQEWKGVPFEVPQPGPIMGALSQVGTAPMTPQQQGAGSGGASEIAPNAQLMKAFNIPAVDKKGAPILDPLTGRQATNFDAQGYESFLGWYAQNRARFPNINEALIAFKTQGAPVGQGASDPLAEARAAIAAGAPRDAVIARLRQNGINPEGL